MRDLAPNMTDYLETRASFRLEVPDTYNYARDVVDAWAAREPDKLALLAVGPDGGQVRRFGFADLARASDRAARFLAAQGVRKGDRVFVMLPRIPDWYDVVLGCIKLGAVPMPATTLLTPRDIAYRVTQAEAAVAVVDAEGAGKVDEVAADCPSLRTKVRLGGAATDAGWLSWADGLAEAGDGPPEAEPTRADDPMLLYFTSGTVAYPKVGLIPSAPSRALARDGAEGEQMAWTPEPEDVGDATRAVVVAIYCRLSQFGGKGLGRQEEDCRRIAAARGWVVDEVFAETASANPNSKKARKEWLRLLDAIQHHEFDAVVVWLEDRTNRNVVEAAEFVTLCREAGVRVIIAGNETEYDFNDPEDVAKFYGESARAQAELARMQKRVTRVMRQIAEQGKWNGGGRRPFGYKEDRVTIDENEAALLREAARRVLAGDSLRGICTDWNRRGIRTSTGQEWVNTVLRRTLISPRIAGFREHNGQLIPAVWPAILDQQTWEAVRAILTDPARVTWKGAPPSYLLTGLIHCGKCGNRMFGLRRAHVSGHEYVIYLCHNRVAGGCVSRDVRYVDKEVTERLLYRLESTAFEQAASRPAEDPTRELYEQLAMEQGIYDRLEDKLARELISEDAFKRHRAESEERMNALRRKIAKLTDDRVITHIPRNLREVWPGLSLDRRRAILAAMIRRIEVHPQRKGPGFNPNTIKVYWKG